MIASLGMYDMAHLKNAHDRLWRAIRSELGFGPNALTRGGDPWEEWQSSDLLLGQTCGLPYRARLHDQVALVGTPDYDLPDCPAGYYFSYLIRRRDDPRDLAELSARGTLAYNEPLSQSGWAAPLAHMAQHNLRPIRTLQTHAHVASISAILDKRADYAAIDALTLLLWGANDADAVALLDAFERTDPTPALPFITAQGRDTAPIATAIKRAIASLAHEDRHDLRLKGLIQIPKADYLALPIPSAF
ncbi:MAG: PhnD/SsuA/transferrin family substrate-binding protein [Tateyamaria sp.]|uniref:phosphate/phosphite/phosphonate ABC transporter substrate-binding protein n=1 Tax=Tateyamaria sp. TaxID=1929288 RepID=UPI0032A01214